MSKIRVITDTPVLNDSGVTLYARGLAGPSSETKPTADLANGSRFWETDTGKKFIFDEDDGWSETGSGGGGGSGLPDTPGTDGTYVLQNTVESGTGTLSWASGGSSGGGVFLVTINYDESENADVLDKTWQEIHDAFVIDGKQVVFTFATDPLYPDFHSYYTLISVTHEESNPYTVAQNHNGMAEVYEANAASDYPALHYND